MSPLSVNYHVWVIPVPRASHWLQNILVSHKPVQDRQHVLPGVLDVVIVTPKVADVGQQSVVHLDIREGSVHTRVTLCPRGPPGSWGEGSTGDRVGRGKSTGPQACPGPGSPLRGPSWERLPRTPLHTDQCQESPLPSHACGGQAQGVGPGWALSLPRACMHTHAISSESLHLSARPSGLQV